MAESASFKQRRQTERLLCSQFVAEHYPRARTYIQQYVGPNHPEIPEGELTVGERNAMGTGRRRADAILILPDKIVLLETYVHVQLGKLSQLMTYRELLPLTPELKEYVHLPIEAILVGAQRDPILDQMAARFDIKVVIFRPKWALAYLDELAARKSRDRKNAILSFEKVDRLRG